MMQATSCRRPIRHGLSQALLALLAAGCGGGGGGSAEPPGNIDVTAANQDVLARAGFIAIQGDVIGGAVGAVSNSGRAAPLGQVGRKRIAAVNAPQVEACFVSGSITNTLDDRDDSGTYSVGDVETSVYNDCVEIPGEVTNGTLTATYTQIDTAQLTVEAQMTTSNLTSVTSTRSASLQGDFSLLVRLASLTSSSLRITVGNSLTLGIATPRFSDTITLRAGYTLDSVYDSAAVPPGGGAVTGLNSTTASGQVASASAAGYVLVRTLQPMLQYDADVNPRSGQFEAVGRTGSLQATVLSTTQVQIDLDADGNGVFDASKVVGWSDLF